MAEMESTVSGFGLGDFLRYGLAGFVGVAAFGLLHPLPTFGLGGEQSAALIAVVSLAWGTLIYTLHRGFVYAFLFKCALRRLLGTDVGCYLMKYESKNGLDDLYHRDQDRHWKRIGKGHHAAARISEWGAQVQFQYCTAWSIILACLIALASCCVAIEGSTPKFDCTCLRIWRLVCFGAAALLLLVAAYRNTINLAKKQRYYNRHDEDLCEQPKPKQLSFDLSHHC